jgi:aspartyl aminopeptidase
MLSKLGLRTVDIGAAILGMHSIRETGGAADVAHTAALFEAFFGKFSEVDAKLRVD